MTSGLIKLYDQWRGATCRRKRTTMSNDAHAQHLQNRQKTTL